MARDDVLHRSRVFENAVICHMEGEFFYRDAYKHEIDIIMIHKDAVIPVEVKYGGIDLKNMRIFLKRFNLKRGIILTMTGRQHIKESDCEIDIIPAYEYLLSTDRRSQS